jgi:hypothetical protein
VVFRVDFNGRRLLEFKDRLFALDNEEKKTIFIIVVSLTVALERILECIMRIRVVKLKNDEELWMKSLELG